AEVVFGAGRIYAGMPGTGSGAAHDGARRGGDSDVAGSEARRAGSGSFGQRARVHRASSATLAGCAESRAVVYCSGQSVGERLQRVVQQPDEGGVCGPRAVRIADGGEGFGSGIQALLESGAVAQRDRIQDAGGIRRRTWAGLRYAPSAPSSITTPTDSHKHWYIKRGQATPTDLYKYLFHFFTLLLCLICLLYILCLLDSAHSPSAMLFVRRPRLMLVSLLQL